MIQYKDTFHSSITKFIEAFKKIFPLMVSSSTLLLHQFPTQLLMIHIKKVVGFSIQWYLQNKIPNDSSD